MAFLSMTGFGRGDATAHGWHAEAEVTCVNRKQLDLAFTLPRSCGRLEPALQTLVRERVSRGRVAVTVQVTSTGRNAASAVVVDEALARDTLERLRALAGALGLAPPAAIGEIAALVPVVRVEELRPADTQAEALVTRAVRQALDQAAAMRKREGLALQRDVLARIDILERDVAQAGLRSGPAVDRLRDSLLARLRESGLRLDAGDERVVREVALFADRCDVSEELTRLASHFAQFRTCAKSTEPVGRTLDFLCQEMFREVNTIGSKTADHEASLLVISLKTELERIREQVQNVE